MTLPRRVGSQSAVPEQAGFLAELPEVPEAISLGPAAPASYLAGSCSAAGSAYLTGSGVASVEGVAAATESESYRASAAVSPSFCEDSPTRSHSKDHRHRSPERQSGRPSSRPCPCQKSVWRQVLSQVNAGLAPFAGILVVAVLLSSAGLLFKLVTDSRRVDTDADTLLSWEEDSSVQAESQEAEESLPTVAPPQENATAEVEAKAVPAKVDASLPEQPTSESPQTEPPVAAAESLPTYAMAEESANLGSLGFPQTSTPAELDYGQAQGILAPVQGPALQALPAVAGRDTLEAGGTVSR